MSMTSLMRLVMTDVVCGKATEALLTALPSTETAATVKDLAAKVRQLVVMPLVTMSTRAEVTRRET